MTAGSLRELLSHIVAPNETRWNDIFTNTQPLPTPLTKIQEAATAELSRREAEGVEDVTPEAEWGLPTISMQHNLQNFGVYSENPVCCAYRSVVQNTGIKIKLDELDSSPTVDIPTSNQSSVCRYYIWKGIRQVSGEATDQYFKTPTEPAAELGEGWLIDLSKRPAKIGKKRAGAPFQNNNKRHSNGDSEGVANKKPREEEGVEVKEEPIEEGAEEEEPTTELPDSSAAGEQGSKGAPRNQQTAVRLECRWFSLDVATTLCPLLETISKDSKFKNQVVALQLNANSFWKEKQGAQ